MTGTEQPLASTRWRDALTQQRPDRPPRRVRWLPATAAAAAVAVALAALALGGRAGDQAPTAARPAGTWTPMSPSPLSPRLGAWLVGWGERVVVLGGRPHDRPCPPNASCVRDLREAPRDAAVYDVPTDSWQRLPDAPVPLDVAGAAVLDDVLYVWLPGAGDAAPTVLSLHLTTRQWAVLPSPPAAPGAHLRLVAAGDRVVAGWTEVGAGGRDLAWVPAQQRWEQLPVAPFGASFDRSLVWTGEQLVLLTAGPPPSSLDTGPRFMRAAVLDEGQWRVLPEQDRVLSGSLDWSWTGDRVVSATTSAADGGEVNGYGRSIPSGGYLDPSSGTWTTLPPTPAEHSRSAGGPAAAGRRWVANGEGLVLDTARERWLVLPPYEDQPDQEAGAAWAAERLVVWGGADGVRPAPEPDAARVLGSGAVWTPARD